MANLYGLCRLTGFWGVFLGNSFLLVLFSDFAVDPYGIHESINRGRKEHGTIRGSRLATASYLPFFYIHISLMDWNWICI